MKKPDRINRLQFLGGFVAPLQMGLLYLGGDTPGASTSLVVPSGNTTEPVDPLLLAYIKAHPLQPVSDEILESAPERLTLASHDISHLAATLGRFFRGLPRGIIECPFYTFVEKDWKLTFRHDLYSVDEMALEFPDRPGERQNPRPYGYAGYNNKNVIIGYDTEYVTTERLVGPEEERGVITQDLRMVSHQVYFSIGIEHSCLVLVTEKRFTQKAFFRELLANAIPETMVVFEPGRGVI